MQQINFRCTDDTFGMPTPDIPDGTCIILVQDGRAEIGRYEAPRPPDDPFFYFVHPTNAEELAAAAMHAVLAEFPDTDAYGDALVFTCPPELARRAVWH